MLKAIGAFILTVMAIGAVMTTQPQLADQLREATGLPSAARSVTADLLSAQEQIDQLREVIGDTAGDCTAESVALVAFSQDLAEQVPGFEALACGEEVQH